MCVIVIKPAGQTLPDDIMRKCWQANPDGAGFMWAENGEVVIRKGYMRLKHLRKAWKPLEHYLRKNTVVFHFRITTHGETCKEMTHPFRISDQLGMAHNGCLPASVDMPIIGHESDTYALSRWLMMKGFTIESDFTGIEAFMGHFNKIAMLGGNGDLVLLNETLWYDHDGLQFSNMYWKPERKKATRYSDYAGWWHSWEKGREVRVDEPGVYGVALLDCVCCGESYDPDEVPHAIEAGMCPDCLRLEAAYSQHQQSKVEEGEWEGVKFPIGG